MKIFYHFPEYCKASLSIVLFFHLLASNAQSVSTFEDLPLSPGSYWIGEDGTGGFASGDAYFYNSYNFDWDFWSGGFGYTNTTDVTTEGPGNQSSAITGGGSFGSANYAIATTSAGIKLTGAAEGKAVNGFFVTNTAYAALSMQNGDGFAKKFGGASGNDRDWFKLTITGYSNEVASAGNVEFYLADFRFEDNSKDYIVSTWKWVDLTSLGAVDSLAITLSSSDVGEWGMNTPGYFAIDNFNDPLFAPGVGQQGTSAMHKDSSAFIAWATACEVIRGRLDIADPSSGVASAGTASMALGQPGAGIVSLGDGGTATLTFSDPVANGSGPDFAVFENAFEASGLAFLELAFVEVSSDGVNFFRFPSVSLSDESVQKENGDVTDARKINNLAGKYLANYGTPFDLEELKDIPGLDVNHITHIRIIDVVGSIDPAYATYDALGNKINDPYPTAFPSGGFDLDAVGVIHTATSTGIALFKNDRRLGIYPNPVQQTQDFFIDVQIPAHQEFTVQIYDFAGQLLKEDRSGAQKLHVPSGELAAGVYLIKLVNQEMALTQKLIIQ